MPTLDLARIGAIAGAECERQHVGLRELGYLIDAYLWMAEDRKGSFTEETFEILGSLVEPRINRNGYRKTPVTFANGGSSANASEIPRLIINLRDAIKQWEKGRDQEIVDVIVKQFLWIHPFADGNGRVGFLLQNYLEGTLDYPNPLRNHFG